MENTTNENNTLKMTGNVKTLEDYATEWDNQSIIEALKQYKEDSDKKRQLTDETINIMFTIGHFLNRIKSDCSKTEQDRLKIEYFDGNFMSNNEATGCKKIVKVTAFKDATSARQWFKDNGTTSMNFARLWATYRDATKEAPKPKSATDQLKGKKTAIENNVKTAIEIMDNEPLTDQLTQAKKFQADLQDQLNIINDHIEQIEKKIVEKKEKETNDFENGFNEETKETENV